MTTYTAPLGTDVDFSFIESGYVAPDGDAVNFSFSNGYEETCEEAFDFTCTLTDSLSLHGLISEAFINVDSNLFYVNHFPILIEELFTSEEIINLLIATNIISSFLDVAEQLVIYLPTGIIQLLSNPFVLVGIESSEITLTAIEESSVILTNINQIELTLTELSNSVILTEVL